MHSAVKRAQRISLFWLKIYGGPELAGLLAAATAFGIVHASGGPLLGSAILGSWAEDFAFVGYFAVRTVREQSGHHDRRTGARYYLLTFSLAFWSLLIELGPAEAIDKFVRPALLYEIPHSLHSLAIGFVVAKFSADIVYYFFAYAGRTIRMRYVRSGPPGLPPCPLCPSAGTEGEPLSATAGRGRPFPIAL